MIRFAEKSKRWSLLRTMDWSNLMQIAASAKESFLCNTLALSPTMSSSLAHLVTQRKVSERILFCTTRWIYFCVFFASQICCCWISVQFGCFHVCNVSFLEHCNQVLPVACSDILSNAEPDNSSDFFSGFLWILHFIHS